LKLERIPKIILDSAIAPSVIMPIMATGIAFSHVLTGEQIPQKIAEVLLSIATNKYTALFLFNIIVPIAGCFLQSSAAIALPTPILPPAMQKNGISPYLVGIIFIVNMGIGMITPPAGSCLCAACNISNLKFEKLVEAIVPHIIVLLAALMTVTYIEPIGMFLIR
jgi:C4-dicarboxylate transporter DctM subunit